MEHTKNHNVEESVHQCLKAIALKMCDEGISFNFDISSKAVRGKNSASTNLYSIAWGLSTIFASKANLTGKETTAITNQAYRQIAEFLTTSHKEPA